MRSRKLNQLLAGGGTSRQFLELASAYQLQKRHRSTWADMIEYCQNSDFGCSRRNLDSLADRGNWSSDVVQQVRRPRIALRVTVNQSNSLVVSYNGADDRIVFPQDFTKAFWAEQTVRGWHSSPGACDLMWVRNFGHLCSSAYVTRNPVAQALLAAFHARLKELIMEISQVLTLMAASSSMLVIEDGEIIGLDIAESEEMRRLEHEMRSRE